MIKTYFINSTQALYNDAEFGALQSAILEAGIIASSAGVLGMLVEQQAVADMTVKVSAGKALVQIVKSGVTFKVIVENDASVNVTIPANSSGANRVGAVVLRVSVSADPNVLKSNVATLEYVPGTSTSPLSDGAITSALGSDGWIRLADVTVSNGDVAIITSEIADTRVKVKTNQALNLSPEVISFSILASDPASPVEGQFWYNSTTHTLKYRDNGTTQTLQTSLGDATSQAGVDQSQTTMNGSVEVGEANATTKKNKIAQSFIPTKSKMRGVKLWKLVNLGSFTGQVTISLQANNAGSPSGSDLASRTYNNTDWNALSLWEFETIFDTEYTALVPGALYWIVITTTTSDNSNHPALGTNTAGGYGSGSVKYWNTTDGWVAIATIDLYFKTLEGNSQQIAKTASPTPGSWLADELLPPRIFFQIISMYVANAMVDFTDFHSNQYGSVLFPRDSSKIYLNPRTKGGSYPANITVVDHNVLYPKAGTNYYPGSIVDVGQYSYQYFNDYGSGVEGGCVRWDRIRKSFTGNTKLTISGGSWGSINRNGRGYMYTDGTYFYVWISSTTWNKYSLSGTTMTYVGAVTGADMSSVVGFAQDTQYYYTLTVATGVYTLNKYDFTGSLIESRIVWTQGSILSSTSASATTFKGLITGTDGVMYMIFLVKFSTATSDGTGGAYYFLPIATS